MPWDKDYKKRTKKLQVWVRPDEEERLRERAITAGYKTIPAYLRAVGLGEIPDPAPGEGWVEIGGPVILYTAPEGTPSPEPSEPPGPAWVFIGSADGASVQPDP